jgi:hypothetical protein
MKKTAGLYPRQRLDQSTRFARVLLASSVSAPLWLTLTGCASADELALSESLNRYAELSVRTATANWPVEFGSVLSGEALAAAEAGYLLLADGGFSQIGSISFRDLVLTAPGEARACLDLSESRILHESGAAIEGQPSEQVQLGYHRLGGSVKISNFELVGAPC